MRALTAQIKMSHGSLPSDSEMGGKKKSQGQKIVTIWTSCQAPSKEMCPDDFSVCKVHYLSERVQLKCAFVKPISGIEEKTSLYFLWEERVCFPPPV